MPCSSSASCLCRSRSPRVSVVWWFWSAILQRLDLRKLEPVESGIRFVARQDLGVAADGLHGPAVHDDDLVRAHDRRQAVGDYDRRRALDHVVDGPMHETLRFAVERAGGLIQDQDL